MSKTVSANEKGEFVFPNVPNGKYNLEISFVGYDKYSTSIQVLSNTVNINAALKQLLSSLDEAVVIAYGTTTKRLNTGNVSTVTGETISKQPVGDFLMALEGRVPGVYISQNSGIPGAVSTVQLRGQNSIANGNDPLYIVDGVPVTSASLTSLGGALGNPSNSSPKSGMSPFNSLNPSDIESIDVLKDADATAIYGSRGANGVILITTKKGKAGKTQFGADVYTGAGKVASKINMLNTQQYLAMRREALKNDGKTPGISDYDLNGAWDTTAYTDWQKIMIGGTANFTNAQASLSGGSAGTQFLIGSGYSKQTTVYPGDYADQKTSLHFNLNHTSPNRKLGILLSAGYVRDNSKLPQIDFASNITLAPNSPSLYDNNGNLNWANSTWTNPLAALANDAKAVTDNLISNLNLSYQIFPGLQLKSSFGYTHIQLNQTNITRLTSFNPSTTGTNANNRKLVLETGDVNSYIVEPQLNYEKHFRNAKLNVLLGSTFQQNINTANSVGGSGFSSDELIPNLTAASSFSVSRFIYTQYRYNAFFGRVNYNWKDKYLFNITGRRDGSSRFGPGKQFGNFGAIGAAWIFTQEQFIKNNLPFLSFGKLRVSYGSTGNDQLTDYQYLDAYSPNSNTYQGLAGLSPVRLVNADYRWEMVKKLEVGMDMGFLKDRIMLNLSCYRNRTDNQLVGYPLPATAGFTTVQYNLPAIVQNTGFELELNTINIKTKDFIWNSSFNISVPSNKLVSYPGLAGSTYYQTYAIGKPLFIKRTLHYTGVDPQTGLYTTEDIDKNGTFASAGDYQFSKSVAQSYYGGLQNSVSFKGLQLDVFIQFAQQTGYTYLNLFGPTYPVATFNMNKPVYILNRWQKPGDLTVTQKFSTTANTAFFRASDGIIQDASFVRVKNVLLSYTLPSKLEQKMHLQNAKIYLSGQNLFTITKYEGLDPETRSLSLPPLRMVVAGIQLTL